MPTTVTDDLLGPDRDRRREGERALITRIQHGDERAFELLYRAYYRPLVSFVVQLIGSAATAEEVVEDVFVHLWEHRETLELRNAVNTYLFTAARNRAFNVTRHERVERRWREHALVDEETDAFQDTISPEAAIDAERIQIAVRNAIAALPEQRRLVLTLRWQQGMSYAEIAQVVGSSVVAVERQLSRTLKALRMALPEWLGDEDRPSA